MAAVIIISDGSAALELKHFVETNLVRVSYHCIRCYFTLTFLLNSYTQATRRSASVIKVGVEGISVCVLRCLKEDLV